MELDTTTFVLEIINFLVLVWLLTRFLFRPVQAALAARAAKEADAAKAMAAERLRLEAQTTELADKSREMERLREQKLAELTKELAKVRQDGLDAANAELAAERQKARQALDQEIERKRQAQASGARQQAGQFVSDYLRRLASPAMEAAIIDMFVTDLQTANLPWIEQTHDGQVDADGQDEATTMPVSVTTAFPVASALGQTVETALRAKLGEGLRLQWAQEADVVSGIRVHLPGHLLEFSLARGLEAFAATSPELVE